jgi:hypothetical protein
MDNVRRIAWNKVYGAVIAFVIGPMSLLIYDPPRSYFFVCAGFCLGWYEAFGLFPNMKRNATIRDVYRAFRAMPTGDNGFSSRMVGLLGLVLIAAGLFVRT